MSARREQHECNTNYPSATRVRHEQHKCDASATRVLHEWHECDTSATRLKNFKFDDDMSENIFSNSCISCMMHEKLKGEKQFHSKNYFFGNASLPHQNAFEKCTTKTELSNGKSYIK